MPIYHVTTPNGERLVEAANAYQAVRHVVKQTITAKALNVTDLVPLIEGGMKIERAGLDDLAEQQTGDNQND